MSAVYDNWKVDTAERVTYNVEPSLYYYTARIGIIGNSAWKVTEEKGAMVDTVRTYLGLSGGDVETVVTAA